ncbi:iron-containing alcohol dehydrogenase [Parendozoicomonas haliclonae]|uniref:NADH-dependent butanol dehydrogenase A n=1 Tax=Parendozoicomonas haliclonae TaxID=1960125 RepID=A0A1X7ARI3_9GAMM|nr:iron-containing alcohol dehydrogenase [Parendozoicomonas haliclonae]SMA50700.1 NADH-dependent butanol dehydrogenase A [Parendozoicomonas haliclonae]
MLDFQFSCPTKIIFGKDSEQQLGSQISLYGRKVLLHYGGGSVIKSGLHQRVINTLAEAGVEVVELSGVQPNPRLSLVREGVALCKEHNIDSILAVGGGSVIDSAKAIAAGTCYEGDVWDFFTGKAQLSEALPLGVILTIPAAGSESSSGTVITNEDGWLKRSMGGEILRPKFAIMNPELTYSLPPYQTACGIVDMMAHILERYFSNTESVELTDRLSEAALTTIINNAPKVLDNAEDYDARAEIMWAGTLAHNGLMGTGREGDWASHQIEHELSGIYDIAHGAGLAIVFPAWMKFCQRVNPSKLAQFAERVMGVPADFDGDIALEGIARFETFLRSLAMPVRLSEADIDNRHFEEMATKCIGDGLLGNYVQLSRFDIVEIYKLAQ